jgi:prepilin-type N-terminal cleavage/methylation domain-containing protein
MRKSLKGFTLVELMVVLAILGIVVVGVLGLVTQQNKAYHSEEAIIDLQMNGRLAINHISRYIRMGGFGCCGNIDALTTSTSVNGYGAAINAVDGDPNDVNVPDELTVVTAARKVGIVNDNDGTADESFQSISVIPVFRLVDSITDLFNNTLKRYIYLAPCENSDFLSIQNTVSSGDTSVTLTKAIRVDEGAEIYIVKAYTFSIKNPSEYNNPKPPGPNLVVNENTGDNRQELAENIENLQFQYGWDKNGDGRFDPTDKNDWSNDPSGNEADIKAVRIYVLARSAHPDRDYTDRKQYKINDATASDAEVIVGPYNDNYHRFLLRTTIMVRNLNL